MATVTVTGERPTKRVARIRPHFRWSWSHMVKPRLYVYLDAWQGGSLIDVGFELVSSWSDPVIRASSCRPSRARRSGCS